VADGSSAAVEAAVREFCDRAGATRVTVVVDLGDAGPPMLVDALEDGSVEIDLGARDGALPPVAPSVPDVRAIPPLRVARTAEGVDLPLVQLAYLAGHLRAFAAGLGGRSVATAHFATADPDLALVIAAREGEPLVVVVGGEMFPLPDGWPD
jgi:hypothetical protein